MNNKGQLEGVIFGLVIAMVGLTVASMIYTMVTLQYSNGNNCKTMQNLGYETKLEKFTQDVFISYDRCYIKFNGLYIPYEQFNNTNLRIGGT